jgi:hypothetical protein
MKNFIVLCLVLLCGDAFAVTGFGIETKITTAIAMEIDIQSQTDVDKFLNSVNAERKIEVVIKFNGEQREFTLQEFTNRLGFGGISGSLLVPTFPNNKLIY